MNYADVGDASLHSRVEINVEELFLLLLVVVEDGK